MDETINDIIRNFRTKTGCRVVPKIHCKDGFSISVQASEGHYCYPRLNVGPWAEFELGFPSEADDLIMEYIDDREMDPTKTVYGYVPIDVVNKLIAKHGGIVKKEE